MNPIGCFVFISGKVMNLEHQVEDYFAGALKEEERAAFEQHLDFCEDCKDALEELRNLDLRLSEDLSTTRSAREPRIEWLEQVKTDLAAARRGPTRWLAPVTVSAVAVVLVVLLILLQPWTNSSLTPNEILAGAHESTLKDTFIGTITVSDANATILKGTFEYARNDRWSVTTQTASGQTIEEIHADGRVWQRQDKGSWTLLRGRNPIYTMPNDIGQLDSIPGLIDGVSTLSMVERLGSDTYSGVDEQYFNRVSEINSPNAYTLLDRSADHQPEVVVSVSETGSIETIQLHLQSPITSEDDTVVVDLVFEEYGVQVHVEPPVP